MRLRKRVERIERRVDQVSYITVVDRTFISEVRIDQIIELILEHLGVELGAVNEKKCQEVTKAGLVKRRTKK